MDPNSLVDARIARCKSRSLAATNQTTITADEARFRSLNPNSPQQYPFSHNAISVNPFTQHHPSLPSYQVCFKKKKKLFIFSVKFRQISPLQDNGVLTFSVFYFPGENFPFSDKEIEILKIYIV
jgi:hypothetical protein